MAFISSGGFEQGRSNTPAKAYEEKQAANTYDDSQLREQMTELSRKLQEEMSKANTNIDFSYNDEIKALVVTVREATGRRVIREIPSPEAIELMMKMRDMVGNIFDERV
ncbi:flagellar protein FlaG [Helicobacter bilis]